jgi:hypothetical protein
MSSDLHQSLVKCIVSALDISSDRFIRINTKAQLPLKDVLSEVKELVPDLIVGVLDNKMRSEIESSEVDFSDDSRLLTRLRNQDYHNRQKSVVLVGSASGLSQSGLRDLRTIIDLNDICDSYEGQIVSQLTTHHSGKDLDIRIRLVNTLLLFVRQRALTLNNVDQYLTHSFGTNDGTMKHLYENLWRLGLCPDADLINKVSFFERIEFNWNQLDNLRQDFEILGPKTRLLKKSDNSKVKAFVSWLESQDDEDLANAELTEVLDALQTSSKKPTRRLPSFLETLGNRDLHERNLILSLVHDELEPEDFVSERLDREFHGEVDFKLLVRGTSSRNDPWVSASVDNEGQILGNGQVLALVVIKDNEGRPHTAEIRESAFRQILADQVDKSLLDNYLSLRRNLLTYFPLLTSTSDHALSLLVASKEVLISADQYVESWKKLLRDFVARGEVSDRLNVGIHLGILDGIWRRQLDLGEDIRNPLTRIENNFESASLLPIHPWRLGPLVELAQEILARYEDEPSFVSSALWALDRAIPTFRVLQVGTATLEFSTMIDGFVDFDQVVDNSLPPITSPGSLLGRTIYSYSKVNPWSKFGATALILNPPVGGVLERMVQEMSSSRGFDHEPALVILRDKNTKGLDREAMPDGIIVSYDVGDTRQWLDENQLERDITFYFMSGMRGRATEFGLGSHGTIDLVLSNTGFDREGNRLSVPQLKLAPEKDNEVVSLIHEVSGIREVKSEVFNLTLPATSQAVLPKAAEGTSWIVIGAPAYISSFSLLNASGKELVQIAEFDEGTFRFFVFALSIEPLGEIVRGIVETLPIATSRVQRIKELVNSLTASNPQKIFDIALNRFGSEEALGLINARAIAHSYLDKNALVIEISLDNVSWTQQWFEEDRKRADLIMVSVSSDPEALIPIEIMIVEAKAVSSKEFEKPRVDVEPFTEAVSQVEATGTLLTGLFSGADESLVEALQLRTLIEQVASRAGSSYLNDRRPEKDALYATFFKHISQMSYEGQGMPRIRTLVCTTFLGSVQKTHVLEDDEMLLVSASSKLLEEVLGGGDVEKPEISKLGDQKDEIEGQLEQKSQDKSLIAIDKQSNKEQGKFSMPETNSDVDSLIVNLTRALKLRSENVGRNADVSVHLGPTFVSAAFSFERGAQLAPLQRAESDIARDLGVASIEISNASQQGKIQVLVPRPDRQFPDLVFDSKLIVDSNRYLPFKVGQDLLGKTYESWLSTWPHALVAGTTGSGKTTFMRSLLGQLNYFGPTYSQVVVVDGKGETDYFGVLDNSMFLTEFAEPLLEIDKAVEVLAWLKDVEVPRRKEMIRELARQKGSRVDAKSLYVEAVASGEVPVITPLVVVIDEFNELMIRGGSAKASFIDSVTSVAQAARSVLVHLILATQRPDRTVVPGTIKANLPGRIAFRLPTATDSITVLGHGGAEKLLGWGDMLFQLNGEEDRRLQSFIMNE